MPFSDQNWEKGGSVVTRDCGVGMCLDQRAPESVCDGSGAGDGNGLEPLAVVAACESVRGVAGGRSRDVNVLGVVLGEAHEEVNGVQHFLFKMARLRRSTSTRLSRPS